MKDDELVKGITEGFTSMANAMLPFEQLRMAVTVATDLLCAQIRDRHFFTEEDVTEVARSGVFLVDEVMRVYAERAKQSETPTNGVGLTPEEIDRLHRENNK